MVVAYWDDHHAVVPRDERSQPLIYRLCALRAEDLLVELVFALAAAIVLERLEDLPAKRLQTCRSDAVSATQKQCQQQTYILRASAHAYLTSLRGCVAAHLVRHLFEPPDIRYHGRFTIVIRHFVFQS